MAEAPNNCHKMPVSVVKSIIESTTGQASPSIIICVTIMPLYCFLYFLLRGAFGNIIFIFLNDLMRALSASCWRFCSSLCRFSIFFVTFIHFSDFFAIFSASLSPFSQFSHLIY